MCYTFPVMSKRLRQLRLMEEEARLLIRRYILHLSKLSSIGLLYLMFITKKEDEKTKKKKI